MVNQSIKSSGLDSNTSSAEVFSYNESDNGSVYLQDHTILFVLEGTLTVKFGICEYIINKNELLMILKNVMIEYLFELSEESKIIEYLKFSLKDELLREFTKLIQINADESIVVTPIKASPLNERLLSYVILVKYYFTESKQIAASLLRIKLLELLFDLGYEHQDVLSQLLNMKPSYRGNITKIVEENIMNPVSLNDLAILSGRSLSSFKRDFKAIYNMSPSQWIREKRLDKAKELFSGTQMSVTDICYLLGFENIGHFSRIFKSYSGISPSGYKLSMQVNNHYLEQNTH